MKSLLPETWNTVLLDCGASSTVCGNKWSNHFESTLPDIEKEKTRLCNSE